MGSEMCIRDRSKRETHPEIRSLILYGVRLDVDYIVDRPEVEAS